MLKAIIIEIEKSLSEPKKSGATKKPWAESQALKCRSDISRARDVGNHHSLICWYLHSNVMSHWTLCNMHIAYAALTF
jgi:hypothetical protein